MIRHELLLLGDLYGYKFEKLQERIENHMSITKHSKIVFENADDLMKTVIIINDLSQDVWIYQSSYEFTDNDLLEESNVDVIRLKSSWRHLISSPYHKEG